MEILLVVALIALLGGLGGGLYAGTYEKLVVEKAARQFLLMARYARISAIERGQPYELQLGTKGFLVATAKWNDETSQMEKVAIRDYYCKPVTFEGELKFEAVNITAGAGQAPEDEESLQRIMFLPSGSADSAIIQMGNGKTHYSIAVEPATGKATLYEGPATQIKLTSVDLDAE